MDSHVSCRLVCAAWGHQILQCYATGHRCPHGWAPHSTLASPWPPLCHHVTSPSTAGPDMQVDWAWLSRVLGSCLLRGILPLVLVILSAAGNSPHILTFINFSRMHLCASATCGCTSTFIFFYLIIHMLHVHAAGTLLFHTEIQLNHISCPWYSHRKPAEEKATEQNVGHAKEATYYVQKQCKEVGHLPCMQGWHHGEIIHMQWSLGFLF
jgi:hypothetical protein